MIIFANWYIFIIVYISHYNIINMLLVHSLFIKKSTIKTFKHNNY